MARFREILKNKDFSLLWFAQILSQFGDRLIQLSLIALVYHIAPGSSFQLAKLLSVTVIPVFLIGHVAGVYVDRWDRRKTMFTCDFLRAIMVFSIPFIFITQKTIAEESLVPVYVIVFLVFCLSRFYVPAKLSIIPDLVEPKQLLLANSLANTTGMIAYASLGVGGILVEVLGGRAGFYLAFSVYIIAAILIIAIRLKTKPKKHESILEVGKEVIEVIKKSVIAEIKEGLVYLFKQKDIRFIINILFLLGAAVGSIYVVWITFIQQTFGTVTKDLGLLSMFLGIGLFMGNLTYGRFGQKLSPLRIIFSSVGLFGLALCLFVFMVKAYPYFWVAAGLSVIVGLSTSPVLTASITLIHKVSSDEMRGKVFSNLEIVMYLAFLIFMLISAKLDEYIDGFLILMVVSCILTVIGIIGFLRIKKGTISYG